MTQAFDRYWEKNDSHWLDDDTDYHLAQSAAEWGWNAALAQQPQGEVVAWMWRDGGAWELTFDEPPAHATKSHALVRCDAAPVAQGLPPMPSNVAHVTRRIRRCESDVPAQLVLEHFAMEYARAILAQAAPVTAPAPSASPALPERDTSKPAEQQGLFRKFDVCRTDGSDAPGGKHHGCRYFVLDVDHDAFAAAALGAYAAACEATHAELARDLREKWGASPAALTDGYVQTVPDHCDRIVWRNAYYHLPLAASPADQGEDARDAARYRQLRKAGDVSISYDHGDYTQYVDSGEELDDLCDNYLSGNAAMSKETP